MLPSIAKKRQHRIGSSEAASIMGLNPYSTGYDVWLQKTNRLVKTVGGARTNESSEIGILLEGTLLDWAAGRLEEKILKNQFRVSSKYPFLSCTHDALIRGKSEGMEAKTAGLVGPLMGDWGEELTDQIPDHYLVQCQHQMLVSDLDRVWVPALIGGRGRAMFKIDRSDEIVNAMETRLSEWYNSHIENDIPPEDSTPSYNYARKRMREPNSWAKINPDLVREYRDLTESQTKVKKALSDVKSQILAELGDSEAGSGGDQGTVTFYPQKSTVIQEKRLKEEMPAIYKTYSSEREIRVLRHNKRITNNKEPRNAKQTVSSTPSKRKSDASERKD